MTQNEIEVILSRQLASYLMLPIFIVDPEGHLLFYNEPAESILGQRYQETGTVNKEDWSTIFHFSDEAGSHPDPTVGYRISNSKASLTYIPDHEPALGIDSFPINSDWTSGYDLAEGTDLLIYDSQYTEDEYAGRVGWGHSSIPQAFAFAELAEVKHLVPFHHDPGHSDEDLDRYINEATSVLQPRFQVTPGQEGASFLLG